MAALTCAAAPHLSLAGVYEYAQSSQADQAAYIEQALVKDAAGLTYDVYASTHPEGKERLQQRAKAAKACRTVGFGVGFNFDMERVVASCDATEPHCPTGETSTLITKHYDATARPLDLLTIDDCASVGTAIGSIHRTNPSQIIQAGYPQFNADVIHAQIIAWIGRLSNSGHVPQDIMTNWTSIVETPGLWSFATSPIHGGFQDADILFSGSSVIAITNWQRMQVSDPARDLAWIYMKLDDEHRNTLLSSYARILGSKLDDLIMLRAHLWLQMEQVGQFIAALKAGDHAKITSTRQNVEHLAEQIANTLHARRGHATKQGTSERPSTITVGNLLQDGVSSNFTTHDETASSERPIAAPTELAKPKSFSFKGTGIGSSLDSTNEHAHHNDTTASGMQRAQHFTQPAHTSNAKAEKKPYAETTPSRHYTDTPTIAFLEESSVSYDNIAWNSQAVRKVNVSQPVNHSEDRPSSSDYDRDEATLAIPAVENARLAAKHAEQDVEHPHN